jgi:2,5-furandicarboxylate decarboxylase 1
MKYENLREFVHELEKAGELIRIQEELSPKHEIPAAIKYLDQNRAIGVLFEKVLGYDLPVVGNLLGSRERIRMALGSDGNLTQHYLSHINNPIKPVMVQDAPVKEMLLKEEIDILKVMPVLTHHEKDAGPYLTSAVLIAKDPDTGVRGMGIHRVQVKGKNRLGILLYSPPLSHFFTRYEERDKAMEVAIVVGMDPITFFSSVIWAPRDVDKFELAGGLKREGIKLVKCESVDLEVPAEGEFVLEGRVLPHVREQEGPLGEETGVYATFDNPIAEIEVISHRKGPIYQALMPFTMEGTCLMGVSWEAENLKELQAVFPQVERAYISPYDFGQLIIQMRKKSEEDPKKIMAHALDMNPYTKSVITVDTDVDIYNPKEVAWALSNRFQPDSDILIKKDVKGSVIDPSAGDGYITSKIGFDATRPLSADMEKFEKIRVPEDVRVKIESIMKKY